MTAQPRHPSSGRLRASLSAFHRDALASDLKEMPIDAREEALRSIPSLADNPWAGSKLHNGSAGPGLAGFRKLPDPGCAPRWRIV